MLAARLNVKTVTLSLDDVPIPKPGPGQVRVKVRAAGVCLSDVHLVAGSIRPRYLQQDTVTLGHKIAETIDTLGPGVTGYTADQRVLLQAGEERDGVLYARGADYDGGWAEYTLATATTLVPIPGGLPFEQAAIIPDAVSTSWAAITATAHVTEPVKLTARGRIGFARCVSDVLPLSEAPKAVERLQRKEGNPIRLVLRP
jgi:NADPH:quinone reductase-like Zn-dependent oxidoreductase